ncbi:MAG TPA: hypothetical protein VI072_04255 [Polyangiaceae bacterium]
MPSLRVVAEYHVRGVPESAVQGLRFWVSGFPVIVLGEVPSPEHVLSLQARGRRCVTLLDRSLPAGPYQDPLAFALHDLRHLAKFAAPDHYFEQIGFFATLERARSTTAWCSFEARLDAIWRSDRDRVLADMNGSSVFLFAALKMKLKMAARRALANTEHRRAAEGGPLSREEERFFCGLQQEFLDALGFTGELRSAAVATSTRRDDPERAALLAQSFSETGRAR